MRSGVGSPITRFSSSLSGPSFIRSFFLSTNFWSGGARVALGAYSTETIRRVNDMPTFRATCEVAGLFSYDNDLAAKRDSFYLAFTRRAIKHHGPYGPEGVTVRHWRKLFQCEI